MIRWLAHTDQPVIIIIRRVCREELMCEYDYNHCSRDVRRTQLSWVGEACCASAVGISARSSQIDRSRLVSSELCSRHQS